MRLVGSRGGTEFPVRVRPRAARSGILGPRDGSLEIRVAAPPVDGAANEALVEFLAGALSVPRSDVAIVRGRTSRRKRVWVSGLSPSQVKERLRL